MPPTSKATYSLDPASLKKVERLSRRWQVSKTEALRRALAKADAEDALSPEERIAALHALQKSLKDRAVDFAKWKQTIRDGRR